MEYRHKLITALHITTHPAHKLIKITNITQLISQNMNSYHLLSILIVSRQECQLKGSMRILLFFLFLCILQIIGSSDFKSLLTIQVSVSFLSIRRRYSYQKQSQDFASFCLTFYFCSHPLLWKRFQKFRFHPNIQRESKYWVCRLNSNYQNTFVIDEVKLKPLFRPSNLKVFLMM